MSYPIVKSFITHTDANRGINTLEIQLNQHITLWRIKDRTVAVRIGPYYIGSDKAYVAHNSTNLTMLFQDRIPQFARERESEYIIQDKMFMQSHSILNDQIVSSYLKVKLKDHLDLNGVSNAERLSNYLIDNIPFSLDEKYLNYIISDLYTLYKETVETIT